MSDDLKLEIHNLDSSSLTLHQKCKVIYALAEQVSHGPDELIEILSMVVSSAAIETAPYRVESKGLEADVFDGHDELGKKSREHLKQFFAKIQKEGEMERMEQEHQDEIKRIKLVMFERFILKNRSK